MAVPYERMLDKKKEPDEGEIRAHLGPQAESLPDQLEVLLAERYELGRALRFPFGNSYGWGYKYSHKTKHLFYLFFERGAVNAMLQLGDGAAVQEILLGLSPYARELWAGRYPCGDKGGGWIRYRVTQAGQLDEVLRLVALKCAPRPGKAAEE